jgi:hypothetical protein
MNVNMPYDRFTHICGADLTAIAIQLLNPVLIPTSGALQIGWANIPILWSDKQDRWYFQPDDIVRPRRQQGVCIPVSLAIGEKGEMMVEESVVYIVVRPDGIEPAR